MSDVKQTIQVTNTGLSPILSIAQGTGMVDFEFTISDFQIPAGSTAVAWNIQPTGNIVSQVCTLVENVITVTPPAYYFLRGKNYMQIQVTGADGVNLFTFLIEVWCSPNISAPVVSQNPDLITQLMAMIGNTQDLDTTAKNNLVAAINEIYARGVVDILDTEEEIEANTDAGKATGALVTKQLISDLGGLSFRQDAEGNWGYKPSGADAVIPFRKEPIRQSVSSYGYSLDGAMYAPEAYKFTVPRSGNVSLYPVFASSSGEEYGCFVKINGQEWKHIVSFPVGQSAGYGEWADLGKLSANDIISIGILSAYGVYSYLYSATMVTD